MQKLVAKEDGHLKYVELAGVSTEEKPTGGNLCTGSSFLEVDTGDVYLYNEADTAWYKVGG